NDVINTRVVDGRFPDITKVIPKKKPLFTFRFDPKLLGDTLLAIAELLPPESCSVQCFYYGDVLPLGFCARNNDNGIMIDALVVPLVEAKDQTEDEAEDEERVEPKANGRRRKRENPEANGQQSEPTEPEPMPEPPAPQEPADEPPAQDADGPKSAKRRKKAKV